MDCKVSANLFTKDLLRPREEVDGFLASKEWRRRMVIPCPSVLFKFHGRLRSC